MRKLVVLTGILFLVFGMAAVNQVSADTNVTQFDNLVQTGNTWWNNNNENQETEPNTVTGQVWDLESFNKVGANGQNLSLIGGYNVRDGQLYSGTTYLSGNLFISTAGQPLFGSASPALSYVSGDHSGNAQIYNNFGYNYVVQWIISGTTGTYTVYSIDSGDILLKTSYLIPTTFLDTNPWRYSSGGTATGSTGTLTFTSSSDGEGTHYTLLLANLLGLPEFASASDIWLFYTYQCGNDIMVGNTFGSNVPIPGSVLLLGTGLLGVVGLGWRRRKTKV